MQKLRPSSEPICANFAFVISWINSPSSYIFSLCPYQFGYRERFGPFLMKDAVVFDIAGVRIFLKQNYQVIMTLDLFG